MRFPVSALLLSGAIVMPAGVSAVKAKTCEDQYKACVKCGHVASECRTSTDKCLRTGLWIGPAGGEYPISKKK